MPAALFHGQFWEDGGAEAPAAVVVGGTRPKQKRPPNWGKKEFWEPTPLPKKKKKPVPRPVEVEPGVGLMTMTGFPPVVEVTEHVTVTPGPAVESFTGFHPTVQVDISEEYLIRAAFALLDH